MKAGDGTQCNNILALSIPITVTLCCKLYFVCDAFVHCQHVVDRHDHAIIASRWGEPHTHSVSVVCQSANQCILGNVYLRSNLSRKHSVSVVCQ